MPGFEEYCEEIKDMWDSHWLTNMGAKHQALQKQLEQYLGCDHVILYTNGHLALENAIASFEFPQGAEVITTPFTFASTTHAIVRNGLIPVFCDIRADNYTMDVSKIEDLVTEKTCAIVPVHVYGNVCDVDAIEQIAAKYHLKVIYDAAHAFGVSYRGIGIANYGDLSMFSFHATKVFNTIEGGAVCFRDNEHALVQCQKLNDMKNFGIHGPEEVAFIGGNAKMNEFQAAMGICNLRHINDEIQKRKKATEQYFDRLSNINGIILCDQQEDVQPNYSYMPVVFDNYKYSRDEVYAILEQHEIIARKYFYPLTNDYECYRNYPTAGKERTPVADYISQRVLTLPLYAEIDSETIDQICNYITK